MDKILRAAIVAEVRQAMMEVNERWVTADVLCEHVGTMTKRWLKEHGHLLDRTRVEWRDRHGQHHEGAWLYPLHKIQVWIATGKIKELKEK